MNRKILLFLFVTVTVLSSCKNEARVNGLWIVKQVKVGDQEMTPNARWTRFNADSTQQSGNGWFQHSYGKWNFDTKTNELKIVNENGINDPYGAFNVRFENQQMLWDRIEEGDKIEVILERSNRLPETFGDQLLGLWQLESAKGNGKYFDGSANLSADAFIFFRWDRRFVIGSEKGRITGVYNVHGHKPEVELIPYGDQLERDFWSFEIEDDAITLKLLNSDTFVTRKFVRVHEFPE